MIRSTFIEIILRTIKLDSVVEAYSRIDTARDEFIKITRDKDLSPRMKVAKYKKKTAEIFGEDVDLESDAINQIKIIDNG